ncbi:hypothetical protein [Marinobacterium iners]|uniref:Uncharacterized protein n=1 Tax=Marinobacterium iners DSM 11526 TaxID=1122198 RepID=A0A1H4GAN6_9GAMM|nr:hypothetical protein [Marinobacterium iners]SEB05762.1 hypothetical protein SAMN02745729_114104 [Marinobacterium iners DSM 11526]
MFNRITQTTIAIVLVLIVELIVYSLLVKPYIRHWGATSFEYNMDLAGDGDNMFIASTRAIEIDASKPEVWRWLMQLGADRAGFFSYDFIEEALGYNTRYADMITPQFKDITTNDVVRGTINEDKAVIPYNFKVLLVEPEETFVLENWGSFLLRSVDDGTTRVVVRTQELASDELFTKLKHQLAIAFHYLMERRMLLGLKFKVEDTLDSTYRRDQDIMWIASIILSGSLIFSLVFALKSFVAQLVLPSFLGAAWLGTLFVLSPVAANGITLLAVVTLVWIVITLSGKRKLHEPQADAASA